MKSIPGETFYDAITEILYKLRDSLWYETSGFYPALSRVSKDFIVRIIQALPWIQYFYILWKVTMTRFVIN